jgi:hypothetical protein
LGRLRDPVTWLRRLLRFAGRVLRSFSRNRGILLSGGVGYNALLSLVPFLTLAVAALSIFFDEERILEMLRSELTALVPQHADLLNGADLPPERGLHQVVSVVRCCFSSIAFRMLEGGCRDLHTSRGTHRTSGSLPCCLTCSCCC